MTYDFLLSHPHILRKPQIPKNISCSFSCSRGSPENAKGHGSDEPAIAAGAFEHGYTDLPQKAANSCTEYTRTCVGSSLKLSEPRMEARRVLSSRIRGT